jgi:hypothetical protein
MMAWRMQENTCGKFFLRTGRITTRFARTWRSTRMRPWVGRCSGPVSLLPSRSCPGRTTTTSGYDFRKGQGQIFIRLSFPNPHDEVLDRSPAASVLATSLAAGPLAK